MVLTLIAIAAQLSLAGFEQIDAATAASRLAGCGLGQVSIRFDEGSQETVLVPAAADAATDEQLACADRAASYYEVQLSPTVRVRFEKIRDERLRPILAEEARQRLARRGLHAPPYREGQTSDAAFTRSVERRCGPRARGAFGSSYGPHALNPAWMQRQLEPTASNNSVLSCIIDMMMAASFPFGFIGNEELNAGEPH